jgi:predicted dehydrogenase
MKRISICVVGTGWFGRKHVETMKLVPQCRLAAIADPVPEAVRYAEALGVPHFVDYREMLDAIHPDAAIIAAPNVLHAPAGIACAERGIHMLVEKPIADTIGAATRLVEAAEDAGVALLVGHHRRYNPIIEKAREIVQSGRIGQPTAISAQWMLMKAADYFDAEHRRLPGAGPILTNAVHDIDDLRHICGEIASVQAFVSTAVRHLPVEDSAAILLRFAGGALATLTVSDTAVSPWSWELTSGENPLFPRHDENCYLISGSEGALTVPRLEIWRYGDQKGWSHPLQYERLNVAAHDPLVRQLEHFCEVVAGKAQARVSGRDAMRTLLAVEAIFTAARSGQAVELPIS